MFASFYISKGIYEFSPKWFSKVVLSFNEQLKQGKEFCKSSELLFCFYFVFFCLFSFFVYVYIHVCICIISKINHYLASLSHINIIYLIHMQREGTVVNRRRTTCYGTDLILDSNQNMLKLLISLFNSSLYVSVLVLEPLLMYFLYCSIVHLI